ncbi:Aste57867_11507 [Aphanomyces stellatus]|uniref:Aste57867_11507 protein n=1 Tax=Aphanomyces stellatus TaxID=120398 RepID=A0A485KTR5_9STRA|nr:hypothetical protein As57867_011464 [Aphanomyces stellatus]VFT88368.1 Aste57867_11507 [Aphanomyces stellatus]
MESSKWSRRWRWSRSGSSRKGSSGSSVGEASASKSHAPFSPKEPTTTSSFHDVDTPAASAPSRSPPPPYTIPASFKDDMENSIATMLASMEDLSFWTFHSTRDGVHAYTQDDGTAVLGIGSLLFSPHAILDVLVDSQQKLAFDATCAAAYRVRDYDAHTFVEYVQSKPALLAASRDFVNLVHWRPLHDDANTLVVVARAIVDDATLPLHAPSLVRGAIAIAGWKLVPNAAGGTDVTAMVKMEHTNESLLSMGQARASLDHAFCIAAVGQLMRARVSVDDDGRVASAAAMIPTPPPPPPASSSLPYFGIVLLTLYAPPALLGWDSYSHDVLLWAVIGFAAVRLGLGACGVPHRVSPVREVSGDLDVDVTDALAALAALQTTTNETLSLTHVVLHAVADALRHEPRLNGHILWGQFYPAATVDVSFLTPDDEIVPLHKVDATNVVDIALQAAWSRRHASEGWKSVWPPAVQPLVWMLVQWWNQSLGLPLVQLPPRCFGQALVTTSMGFDAATIPMWLHLPLVVVAGEVAKKPVVDAATNDVVVRSILPLRFTIDARYVKGADVVRMVKRFRDCMETPAAFVGKRG